ncbi:uncharacterized protein LOC123199517 [Mangifera indica]|uniref:uncharacterized protein LOC123199517 n=1 Tax=Mangifera indica TaxID=29780 RepID=UPI001CFAAB82|nr:uncharacterized protein LOC123199517 [Mangifera indica]
MANSGDKNVQKNGQDGDKKESPQQERRNITPSPQVPRQGDGEREVPARRERAATPAGEGSGEKKRWRRDDPGASSSGVDKRSKSGGVLEIPSRSHTCCLCGKKFQSLKAVFGHMRSHKIEDVLVQGALPLPVYIPDEPHHLKEQLAPALLNAAQGVLQGPHGRAPAAPRGLNIDLNEQTPQSEGPTTFSPSSPKKGGRMKLDLNKPPPPEDDDGDDGGGGSPI